MTVTTEAWNGCLRTGAAPRPAATAAPAGDLRVRSGRRVGTALDDFPYRADDFAADEAVFNGKHIHNPDDPTNPWQRWAYDLGAARRVDGTWVETTPGFDWRNPRNTDFVVYGKPVYAVSDGVVVNAWRNAPENPRPFTPDKDDWKQAQADRAWLHPSMRAEEMYGAGNFLLVREDDGNLVGYAHAMPGTISPQLCPHEGELLDPKTWEADSAVPPDKQVRVRRGQLLFRTGNSGNSSAPHLHIDRNRMNPYASIEMRFRHGMAIRTDPQVHGKPVQTSWTSFAGSQIPGPAAIRPPYKSGGQYGWHGLTASAYADTFVHLADSGYRVSWLDGYSVAGKPYFNVLWRPSRTPWLGYHLLSAADYQARFDDAVKKGFVPTHVDSFVVAGTPRYNAVFAKEPAPAWVARHGLDDAGFQTWFDEVAGNGFSPVSVSVVSVKGRRQHTALFRQQDIGGWVLKTAIPAARYQAEYDENAKAGRYPVAVNAYTHQGAVFYCVAFAQKPTGSRLDRHGLSAKAYQAEFGVATKAGLSPVAVAGVDGTTSNHEFIAAWRA